MEPDFVILEALQSIPSNSHGSRRSIYRTLFKILNIKIKKDRTRMRYVRWEKANQEFGKHIKRILKDKEDEKNIEVLSEKTMDNCGTISLRTTPVKKGFHKQIAAAAMKKHSQETPHECGRHHLKYDREEDHSVEDEDTTFSGNHSNSKSEVQKLDCNDIRPNIDHHEDDPCKADCDSNHETQKIIYISQPDTAENKTVKEQLNQYLRKKFYNCYYLKKEFIFMLDGSSPSAIFERGHKQHITLQHHIRRENSDCDLTFYHHHHQGKLNENNEGQPVYSFLIKCRDPCCQLKEKLVYFHGQEPREDACTLYLLERTKAIDTHSVMRQTMNGGRIIIE